MISQGASAQDLGHYDQWTTTAHTARPLSVAMESHADGLDPERLTSSSRRPRAWRSEVIDGGRGKAAVQAKRCLDTGTVAFARPGASGKRVLGTGMLQQAGRLAPISAGWIFGKDTILRCRLTCLTGPSVSRFSHRYQGNQLGPLVCIRPSLRRSYEQNQNCSKGRCRI